MSDQNHHIRYQRQIQLKEFGSAAQEKLTEAKVLVIGAGGLGCPALQYLAVAGVGTIGIVDFDRIDETNLNRQILYAVKDIGHLKVKMACEKLKALNPDIHFIPINTYLSNQNAIDVLFPYDIIIDGSDNFATRYLVNDACVILNKPLVYGAISGFEGQVGVLNVEDVATKIKTNYRDLFPNPKDTINTLSCNEAGVLGVTPGIIGCMQAAEAIKLITGIGKVLANKISTYHVLENTFYTFEISKQKINKNNFPKTKDELLHYNYDLACGNLDSVKEITNTAFESFIGQKDVQIIDVRELDESPLITEFIHLQIPLTQLKNQLHQIETNKNIVLFCQSGQRSLQAAAIIQSKFPKVKVFNLKGGITAWQKTKQQT